MTILLWKGEASHGQAEEADLAGQAEEAEGRIGRRWRCAVDGPIRNGGRTDSDRTGSLTASVISPCMTLTPVLLSRVPVTAPPINGARPLNPSPTTPSFTVIGYT